MRPSSGSPAPPPGGVATAVVLGVGRAIGEAMAIIMVAGNVANMPGEPALPRCVSSPPPSPLRCPTPRWASLQQQALYSVGLVLFLFIMIINVILNVFVKNRKGGVRHGKKAVCPPLDL